MNRAQGRRWVYAASAGLTLAGVAALVARTPQPTGAASRPILAMNGPSAVVVDNRVGSDSAPPPPRPGAMLASLSTATTSPSPRPLAAIVPAADDARAGVERAKREIAACDERYRGLRDYACVFHKRERINGRLITPHIMAMKVRTSPESIYFKFAQPNRGREAIYVPNRNNGKILAHDVGLGKLLAGTMVLDPNGTMAMDESRHPINEAGIGALIRTVKSRWDAELDPAEARVSIHEAAKVGDRDCLMVETTHPSHEPDFLFHKVKVFIDREHRLPIRFEAYDWPKTAGAEPELVEEYTYADLRTDVGLGETDFDPANPHYSFGRF